MSTIIQKAFSTGEVTPSLYARTDQDKYSTALRTLRNAYTMRHGGIENRGGTKWIGEVKDSSAAVRLIPFVYSQDQSYVLELSNLVMRIIKNDSYIVRTSQAITAITNANPGVLTYGGADTYTAGDQVYISDVVGNIANNINGRTLRVGTVNAGANTFQLLNLDGTNFNTTSLGSYTSGGTVAEIYTVTTVWTQAELAELKYAQSANALVITHNNHYPRTISTDGSDNFSIASTITDNILNLHQSAAVTNIGVAGAVTYTYMITSVDPNTGYETPITYPVSVGSGIGEAVQTTTGNATLSATNFNRIQWEVTNVAGLYGNQDTLEFNVYRQRDGKYYYIGTTNYHFTSGPAELSRFDDIGYTLTGTSPPIYNNPIYIGTDGTDSWLALDFGPAAVTFFQQRLCFANLEDSTETVMASSAGDYGNFNNHQPIQDSDNIQFDLVGSRVNTVNHMVDLGPLALFTQSGEILVNSNGGTFTPSNIDVRPVSYNGSAKNVAPVIVGNSAVYIQARGSVVRDLNYQFSSGTYTGGELSIYASHLVDDYEMVDMAYQQIPHSHVWLVRDDGVLLGLTYIKEQQMIAWHHHDFENGTVENVCVIPSSSEGEDYVYMVIKRTINSKVVRYVERFTSRRILLSEQKDLKIMDCNYTVDGRNTGVRTMTLSGSGWTYNDTLTLTASSAYFASTDVGKEIHLTNTDGTLIRFSINAYTSTTVVTGKPDKTVPAGLQAVATTDWAIAISQVTGLWHLEGQTVSVYGDGFVIASPNNDQYDTITVASGIINLGQCYSVICIGLPITADVQTLNIDQGQGGSIIDRNKLIQKVSMYVEETRGLFAGTREPSASDPLDGLTELKIRESESMDSPVDLTSDPVEIITESTWNNNGRVFIRQVDPLPMTILSIAPSGNIPYQGGGG